MSVELGTAYISILPSTSKLAPAIRKELGEVERTTGRGGERAGSKFGASFKRGAGRLLKGGVLAGIAGGSLIGGAGLKTAAELEQSKIGFETMLGSAEEADKFVSKIKDKAAKTPFELKGLTESSQKLLAMGFASKDVLPTLTTLGDAAAGLGLGTEGLDRLSLVMGQIKAKGKLQGEELLQLTEAGIPAQKILQNELGLTAEEYEKLQSAGKIKADEALPALLKGIKNGSKGIAGETAKFGGLMEKQSQSMIGLFSTLKDTVLVGVADEIKPLEPLIKRGLKGAINVAEKAIKGIASGVKQFSGFVRENKDLLISLGAGLAAAGGALIAYNAYLKVSAFWTKALNVITKIFNGTLKANPIGLVVTAIALLVAGLVLAYKKSDTFRKFIKDKLIPAFKNAKKKIGEFWQSIKDKASKPIDFVINTIYNNGLREMIGKIPGVDKPDEVKWDGFATGGYTGPGPKMKPAGLVHADEFVIRKEARKRFERSNPGALDFLNRTGSLPGYWLGGGVKPLDNSRVAQHTSGYSFARWAGDLNGPGNDYGQAIRAWKSGYVAAKTSAATSYGNRVWLNHADRTSDFRSLYAHMSSFGSQKVGDWVNAGEIIGKVGSTGNSTGPHLHFEVRGGNTPLAASGASIGSSEDPGYDKKGLISLARTVWKNVKEIGSSGWAQKIKDGIKSTIGDLKHWINEKIWGPGPIPGGIFDSGGVLEPGAIAFNASNKPEAVFNQAQFRKFAQEAGNGSRFPKKVELVVGNEKFDAYVRELASDTFHAEDDFVGVQQRMRY